MSTDQSAQGVSLPERVADKISAGILTGNDWPLTQDELDRLSAASWIRTLVSERDALASRVRELEGERDAALADSERRHTLLKMQHAESVELYNALSDLSFECDGVMCVLPPSRETYNRTFMVLKMKPHLSPAALRGHGAAADAALTTTSGDNHE